MKPLIIGHSYTYVLDVLNQLIVYGVILIYDGRLSIGSTDGIIWIQSALQNGYRDAWDMVEIVDGPCDECKKFDQEILKSIGDSGEKFVIYSIKSKLPSEMHSKIIHVADVNDYAGYDIYSPSVNNIEKNVKIEVKTSTRNRDQDIQFFLSRNEFEVGRRNRDWCIVFVSIDNGTKQILGHLYCYQIESRLPRDVDPSANWQNCKILVDTFLLHGGLP